MKKIISKREYNRLKKVYEPQKIIYLHTMLKITLSSDQINELINLRDANGKRI